MQKFLMAGLAAMCLTAQPAMAQDEGGIETLQLEQYLEWEQAGSPQISPDGDTIINFCASGLVERVGPDGDVRWRMETPFGSGLGYFLWMEEPADFLP